MYHLETKLQCEKLIKINGKFGEIGVDYNEQECQRRNQRKCSGKYTQRENE